MILITTQKIRKLIRELKFGSPAPKFILGKHPFGEIMLKVHGGYLTDEEERLILDIGWRKSNCGVTSLTPTQLCQYPQLVTDIYFPPIEVDRKESEHKIIEVFKKAAIPLSIKNYSR